MSDDGNNSIGNENPRGGPIVITQPPFSLRDWFRRHDWMDKLVMIGLTAATLGIAVLQLLASWQVAGGVNEQIRASANNTQLAQEIYRETWEAAERLYRLMDVLVPMTNRLLLMQLCKDHPVSCCNHGKEEKLTLVWQDISSVVCANVSTWSSENGYLETGVLRDLFPTNGTTRPPASVIPAATEPAFAAIYATPGGIAAMVNSGILGLLFLTAAFLLLRRPSSSPTAMSGHEMDRLETRR